ncbi:MAG: hypothetical protein LBQ31_04785 [Bacteroidales bacterium]|jgi:hypothetical protein|nr:hypothetical protein [Bacteroidales bacterium]
MLIFGKKIAYWREKYGGVVLGFIFAVPMFWIDPQLSVWSDFIKEVPAIGMCMFGFLLTFLGIILQGGSETIKWMKSRKTLFERFISFNKGVVILSVVLSIYSYFLVFFNFKWVQNSFVNSFCFSEVTQNILIALFVFLSIWFLYNVIYFIKIFYLLIKKVK